MDFKHSFKLIQCNDIISMQVPTKYIYNDTDKNRQTTFYSSCKGLIHHRISRYNIKLILSWTLVRNSLYYIKN